jgi:hypothetical protein
MAPLNLGFRNIVDVDGQLLGIDSDVIDTATLLVRANRSPASRLWLVRAGERVLLPARQLVRLNQDEVLFFETDEAELGGPLPELARLAA